ncbi:hypothetical protein BDN72DRAFT_835172 [Pluteus cervinus]|uniref:Uncharacterized protein n=1 Tax=Pluteus cervinus TaxID=181527 RepID=A0ACD3B6A4_9AGAR|nr:hypothetical protein BDN72DRAFT_835172 [Pluteus cervinus]
MPQKVRLLALPTEILGITLHLCTSSQLLSIRQVCRAINSLAEPIIFSTISFDLRRSLEVTADQVKSLAEGKTKARFYARRLVIELTQASDQQIKIEGHPPVLQIKRYLVQALTSLKNVRFVILATMLGSPDWIIDGFSRFISQIPLLEGLQITAILVELPPLPGLQNIRSLSLAVGRDFLQIISAVINKAPMLTSLSIDSRGDAASLNDIFDNLVEPRRLLRLNLHEAILDLSENALQHLRSLRALWLSGGTFNEPTDLEENQHADDWELDDEEELRDHAPVLVDQIKQIRPKSTAFWTTLYRECILLEELHVDSADHALFEYIASYTGLQDLRLPGVDGVRRALVDHLADYFYTHALPKHITTLERLCLVSTHTSTWVFGPNTSSLISQCHNLRYLQIGWNAKDSNAKKYLYEIMDLSATLPLLNDLTISYSYPRSTRDIRQFSKFRCAEIYDTLACSLLPRYGPIDPQEHLHCIQVRRMKWKLVQHGDTWRYNYVSTRNIHGHGGGWVEDD